MAKKRYLELNLQAKNNEWTDKAQSSKYSQELTADGGGVGGAKVITNSKYIELSEKSSQAFSYINNIHKDAPIVNMEQNRIQALLNNTDAKFEIKDNPNATANAPWYENKSTGREMVLEHIELIEKEAKKQNIDPELVKAIVFTESARGYYYGLSKLAEAAGVADTVFPMNINQEIWSGLGLTDENIYNPEVNVRAGVILIKRIADRIENPTPAKIASIYNSTGRENVNEYGAYVGKIYNEKPWEKQ